MPTVYDVYLIFSVVSFFDEKIENNNVLTSLMQKFSVKTEDGGN